jgi:TolA-binding protein
MSSSNLKYKAILDRETLQKLAKGLTNEEKKSILKEFSQDSFEADALEGWSKVNYDSSLMKKLDKSFSKRYSASKWLLFASVLILSVLVGIVFTTYTSETKGIQQAEESVIQVEIPVIEKTDIIQDPEIQKLDRLTRNSTARSQTLQKKFNEDQEVLRSESSDSEKKIDQLPFIEQEEIEKEKPKTIRTRGAAKEIYLSDLKLIDYRNYRSRPTVPTEQLQLSGTPADREQEGSEAIESTWKTVDVPYHDYLKKTMGLLEDGKYQKALQRFQVISGAYSDDLNAYFYSGVCYFNLKQYDKAIELLQACLTHPFSNFDEESQWLIANAFEEKGDRATARKLYEEIRDRAGYYATDAQKKL